MEQSLLTWALSNAARGWRVFPVVPGMKIPAFIGWKDAATTDAETIKKWWSDKKLEIGTLKSGRKVYSNPDFNIGIATGKGLFVVDVDVRDEKRGKESFAALNLSNDEKHTFVVRTPSGGLHAYYTTDEVLGVSAGRLGDGIDTRGDGGFVVGPGSVYINGAGPRPYEILRDLPLAGLPVAIASRVRDPERRSDVVPADLTLDREVDVERAIAYLRDATPSGTYAVACRLKDFGVSQEVAIELLLDHWNGRRVVPHSREVIAEKVQHAYEYGTRPVGSDSIVVGLGGVTIEAPPPTKTLTDITWFRDGADASDLKAEWLFFRMMPRRGVMVLTGPSQAGKTFLELELARCLATGKPFFDSEPDELGGTIFLFAGSEGSGLKLRLRALGEPGPLPISACMVSNLAERDALQRLYESIKEEAERMMLVHGVPLRLVVLETLAASGLLIDETNNAEAGRAMANLGVLSTMLDVVFLTTHHPPKDGTGSRGASAIPNAADYVWEIYRDNRDAIRRLDLTKARDAEQRLIGAFTLVETVLGQDTRGRPITSMAVSMGEPGGVIASAVGRAPGQVEAFNRAFEFAMVDKPATMKDGAVGAEFREILEVFNDLTKETITDKGNRSRMFRKCLDYAMSLGAIDDRMVMGIRYLVRKSFT